jgi:hypothetical protein
MSTSDDSFVALGPALAGFNATNVQGGKPVFDLGVAAIGSRVGVQGTAGLAQGPQPTSTFSPFAGVFGTSADRPGTSGTSLNNIGVYGQTEAPDTVPNFVAGVYGTGDIKPGVIGFARDGDGAQGLSFTGTAIRAASFFGPGVHSISGALTGVTGISGTQGPPVSNVPNVAGVVGTSSDLTGVIGTSNASLGVFGFSTNNIGIVGRTTNPNSFAGFFIGNVFIDGTLTATVKNSVVRFPDRTQRVLHCMESPEHWFEDFGTAKLKNGRVTLKLDGDFAKVIKPTGYHVFVTPEGECCGLSVRGKTVASFEVRELGGGKSSVAFSYRIVGRRRDITRHRRFAKIDTRLPTPAAATRARRALKPTPAALRAFIARVEKEAAERRPKGARKARRLRALPPRILTPPPWA